MNYLNHIVDFHFLPYSQGTTQSQRKEAWDRGSEAQASLAASEQKGLKDKGSEAARGGKCRKEKKECIECAQWPCSPQVAHT